MHQALANHIANAAAKAATRAALNGKPLSAVWWVPPATATSDWRGTIVIEEAPPMSASMTPPWDK